jgi:3',5'-cyclic AMP phosphodiesterase CpdA
MMAAVNTSTNLAFLLLCCALPLTAACGDDSAGSGGGGGQGGDGGAGASPHPDPDPLTPLSAAPLTTERTLTYPAEAPAGYDVKIPEDVAELLAEGYGAVGEGPGEAMSTRTLDDAAPPSPGPNARLVTRFVHLADTQLADDESPARVVLVDAPRGATAGAFRPQEGHACHILNAAVRTINKVHASVPIDVVILGGDNADNAQANEVDWFQAVLDGSKRVECDSGADDDPTPGPENDPKDPFFAEGLAVPWKWVTGNHDVLNQGNFTVAFKNDDYLSDFAGAGTRDWSQPGGPITKGLIVADERRAALSNAALLEKVAAAGDGHGIDAAVIAYGKAFYGFDLGESVRVLVLDTSAADSGGAEGLLLREDLEGFVIPALDQARAAGKKVILTSHHASAQLHDGDVFGGAAQPTAVLPEELQQILGDYDNVLMYLAGHTHIHRVQKVAPAGGRAYWEAESSALGDFPHQMRLIEVHDMDNGFFKIRLIGLDYATENDPIAAEGKAISVADYTAGWAEDARGEASDRNVELWVPVGALP